MIGRTIYRYTILEKIGAAGACPPGHEELVKT